MAIDGFAAIDFDEFHRALLPRRLAAGRGAHAARAVAKLGSLALRTKTGSGYTLAACAGGLALAPGDASADTVIELDAEDWQGLVHDYEATAAACAACTAMR